MKKLTIILLALLAIGMPGGLVLADYNDFQTDGSTTLYISALDKNLILSSGANVESMSVGSESISFTILSGSTATITSTDHLTITASGFSNDTLFTCPASGSSYIVITASATRTGIITPSATDCSQAPGATSGSPSSGPSYTPAPTIITPSNASISIQAGADECTSYDVTLTLAAVNATEMMLSNKSNFEGASWENFSASKAWTLSSGLGKKMVYAKFRSSSGGETGIINAAIMLLPAPAVAGISASSGGHVGLADNLVAVDVPANAVTSNTNVNIAATSVFTAPSGTAKLAGNQAYNFTADANGSVVKNFTKDLTLTFKYTAEDIQGISEGSLAVYYWDETNNEWVKVGGTVDTAAMTVTVKVNHFTLFALMGEESVTAGQLVKLKCDTTNASICTAVYYVGNDGKRYVFPTEKTYYTWYADFSGVKEIGATELASYKIGGNVTYKPGVKMVKITTSPKVYAVTNGGTLREIASEEVAQSLYGVNWNKQIDDVPDSFFVNYVIGTKVNTGSDYQVNSERAAVASINVDKGM